MNKTNVLIFPCGSQSGLDIYNALKFNVHFNIFGVSGQKDHSSFIFQNDRIDVSTKYYITNDSFLNYLNDIIMHWNIEYIIPTHDIIARFLQEKAKEINATIVCSPLETTRVAENKLLMYEKLKDEYYFPKVYDVNSNCIEFPVFLKPNISAGGKGTRAVFDKNELETVKNSMDTINGYLAYEFLPGKEYTVDCFTDRKGKLLFVGPRTRERVTNGITYHSTRVKLTEEIRKIADSLNEHFEFRGLWYFQIKEDRNGRLKFLEFSVRHAGTMTYYRQLGVNFPLLSLLDFMGYDIEILINNFDLILDRAIETKYSAGIDYDTIYIDFDDTIIVNNQVNELVISFIYKSINLKKKIILLTKHEKNIYDSLRKYKLSADIFDEIIVIDDNKNKYEYIKEDKAIFIDNYYFDRKSVFENCHIPVFDVDAVESLV